MPRAIRIYIGWFAVAALVALVIYTGHGSHSLYYLPFLIILACPLLHMFMHGGHSGHNHGGSTATTDSGLNRP